MQGCPPLHHRAIKIQASVQRGAAIHDYWTTSCPKSPAPICWTGQLKSSESIHTKIRWITARAPRNHGFQECAVATLRNMCKTLIRIFMTQMLSRFKPQMISRRKRTVRSLSGNSKPPLVTVTRIFRTRDHAFSTIEHKCSRRVGDRVAGSSIARCSELSSNASMGTGIRLRSWAWTTIHSKHSRVKMFLKT